VTQWHNRVADGAVGVAHNEGGGWSDHSRQAVEQSADREWGSVTTELESSVHPQTGQSALPRLQVVFTRSAVSRSSPQKMTLTT